MKSFSITKIGDYLNCQRLFYWSHIMRLQPKILQAPLKVGSLVHKGIEIWANTQNIVEVETFLNTQFQEMTANISQQEFDEKIAMFEGMVYGYIESFVTTKLAGFKVAATEVPVQLRAKVHGDEVLLKGVIDQVLETEKGERWIGEIKTRSSIDPVEFELYPLQYQPRMYQWFARKCGLDALSDVRGVCLQLIKKPSIRRRTKSGESHREYTTRLRQLYTTEPDNYFAVQCVKIPDHLRKLFPQELKTLIGDIIRKESRTTDPLGTWVPNPGFCDYYSTCPYLPLCRYGLSRRTAGGFVKKDPEDMNVTLTV